MIKGNVKRPQYGSGDGELELTATLTIGGITKTIKYNASVKEEGMTDTQIVTADKLNLEFPVDKDNVRNDISLPTIGEYGSTITWASSKENIISASGSVNRPSNGSANAEVTMTATITKGSITQTKEFTCTVIPWTNAEECQYDTDAITWELIKGKNISKNDVTLNLELPTVGKKGSEITWVSNNESIISANGTVTRPSYIQGDTVIALSATITKGDITNRITITGIRVLKLAMTNKEATEKALNGLEVSEIKGDNASLNEITTDMYLPKTSSVSDCSSVSFKWIIVGSDGSTEDNTNANARIVEESDRYLCRIVRPTTSEKNVELNLKCVAESSVLSGSKADSYVLFPIVILKDGDASAAMVMSLDEELSARTIVTNVEETSDSSVKETSQVEEVSNDEIATATSSMRSAVNEETQSVESENKVTKTTKSSKAKTSKNK